MKENKNIPEIRFKGFEGEWEEVELQQLVDVRSGRDYKNLKNGSIPVYGTGGYMLSVNEALSYNEDAIGIGRKGTIDKPFILLAPFWTVDTLFYAVPINKNRLYFVDCIFQNINWRLKDESTGVPSLSKLAINRITTYTTSYNEQSQIGIFFQKLDKQITLEQQKHDKLVTLKKAMLEKMFPKEGARVPEIRFEGFEGEWEEYTLGDISPLRGGFAFQSSQFQENGIPIVKITNILSTGYVGGDFDFYKEQNNDFDFSLPNNAALIAMSGATTGKVSILKYSGNVKVYQNQRVGYFMRKNIVDYSFISTLIRSSLFKSKLDSVLVAGAQPNVSPKEINAFLFFIPKVKKEQSQIGSFFQNLDKLISLQQQKIDKLKNIKKACLEKMFV